MVRRDYYAVLGVAPTASQEEILRAYRVLARRYHPDVNDESGAESRFAEVTEAYEVLRDPDRRARYDRRVPVRAVSPDDDETSAGRRRPRFTSAFPVGSGAYIRVGPVRWRPGPL